jgi:16S rRNA (guanine966-N2)-methyltransferase
MGHVFTYKGFVRITGGKYRGRKIICPPGIIRPAMDRMRESLFSILGELDGKSFLDLYSGSGIIGIEAASRGAEPIFLVEKDKVKGPILHRNIAFVEESITIVMIPVERFIRMQKITFEFIFMDPPFRQKAKEEVIESVTKHGILAPGGRLVIHVPRSETLPDVIEAFHIEDRRTYGGSVLYFYRPA